MSVKLEAEDDVVLVNKVEPEPAQNPNPEGEMNKGDGVQEGGN